MDTLLGTLRQRRDELIERGAKIADATRGRGVDALGKVRDGTLDWRRTLAARRAELGEQAGGWFRFAGLRVRVLDGVDRVLAGFSVGLREQMKRLRRLELPRSTQAEPQAPREAAPERTVKAKPKTKAKAKAKTEPKAKTQAKAKAPPKAKTEPRAKKANGHATPAPKRLVLPIADYDTLSAKDVVAELPRLSDAQCKVVLEHERSHKNRKTVLKALEARLGS